MSEEEFKLSSDHVQRRFDIDTDELFDVEEFEAEKIAVNIYRIKFTIEDGEYYGNYSFIVTIPATYPFKGPFVEIESITDGEPSEKYAYEYNAINIEWSPASSLVALVLNIKESLSVPEN